MGAQYNIVVKVDASSADPAAARTNRALSSIEAKAKTTGEALGKVFEFYAVMEAVRELEKLGDAYLNVQQKLQLVSTSQSNLNGLMDATFEIAQKARVSWESVAQSYQRLTTASQNLGLSQQKTLEMEETIAKAMQISGVSKKASQMAMMELSDAFTTGAMSGRKFRTFIQDAGAVIPILAKNIHMTAGEFVELGLHGQATAKMLRDGFVNGRQDFEDAFAKMTPTITQSFTLLRNAATKFFGELGNGGGVFTMVASAIQFVARHFDAFGRALLVVGEILAVYFAAKAIGYAIDMLGKLRAAAIANPWMELALVLTALVAVLHQFGDKMDAGTAKLDGIHETTVKVSSVMHVLWQDVKIAAQAIGDFLASAWHSLTQAFSDGVDSSGIDFSMRNILRIIAAFAGAGRAIFNAFRDEGLVIFGGLFATIGEKAIEAFKSVLRGVQWLINKMIDAYNGFRDLISTDDSQIMKAGRVLDARDAAKASGLVSGTPQYDKFVENRVNQRTEAAMDEHRLGHVDVNFDDYYKNPLAGSEQALRGALSKTWANMGQDVSKTIASMDEYIDHVWTEAAKYQASKTPTPSDVSAAAVAYDPYDVTPKKKDPLAALKRQLEQVLAHDSPIDQANHTIMHAIDILDQALQHHLVTADLASKTVAEYTHRLYDQMHPAEALTAKLLEQNEALKLNNHEREQANKLEEIKRQLTAAGITEEQWSGSTSKVMFDDTGLMYVTDEVKSLELEYKKILDDREKLEKMNTIEAKHETQINELVKKRADMLDKGLKDQLKMLEEMDFGNAVKGGLKAVQDKLANLGSDMKTLFLGVFDGINEGLLAFINSAEFSWKKLFNKILDDTAKVAMKMLEIAIAQDVGFLPVAKTTVAASAGPLTAASLGLGEPEVVGAAVKTAGASAATGITEAGVASATGITTASETLATGITEAGVAGAASITTASEALATAMISASIQFTATLNGLVATGGLGNAGFATGALGGIGSPTRIVEAGDAGAASITAASELLASAMLDAALRFTVSADAGIAVSGGLGPAGFAAGMLGGAGTSTAARVATGGGDASQVSPGRAQASPNGAPVVQAHFHFHDDKRDLLAGMQGTDGDRIVLEVARKNPQFVRRLLSR